jgi:hypothetical protein
MSRIPHSIASREAFPGTVPLLRTFPSAAEMMRDDAGGTAAALLARAAPETALAGPARPDQRVMRERAVVALREDEGRVPAPVSPGSPTAARRGAARSCLAAHVGP